MSIWFFIEYQRYELKPSSLKPDGGNQKAFLESRGGDMNGGNSFNRTDELDFKTITWGES